MTSSLLAALLAVSADPVPADTAKADAMIHAYLRAEVQKLSGNFMDGAKTIAEWEAKRPKLREQFLDMLGLWPLPEKTDLKATVTGTLEKGDVVIEKLHYQSKPGLYVTANLYRPKDAMEKRLPAILCVCGHSGRGRDGNKTAFQDHGVWFAKNGYVCLIVDTLQLGEIAGIHHGTYRENRWWWHSRGYTPAGVECWNGIRGIDYLCSRADVDPEKIGVTGISGGGATTVWVAAADERVKVAVPVSGMSDLESYVSNKVINGHCDCMFVYNTYRWEWTTILALFAPKPLLFANSDSDPIFPMDGNRRIFARLQKCYELLGSGELVQEYVSKGGHDYRPDLRQAVYQFFERHLKGTTKQVADEVFAVIPGKELRVFPEDKDLPKDAINAKVDETFVPQAAVKLPEKPEDFKEWKAGLVKQLRERCFRALPEKVPPGIMKEKAGNDLYGIESEPGIVLVPFDSTAGGPLMFSDNVKVLVLNPGETLETAWHDDMPKLPPGNRLCWLDTRCAGGREWTRKNPPNTVERSLLLLGQTVDSGRVRDVIATTKTLATFLRKDKAILIGRGQAGILAGYAALLDRHRVCEIVLIDPPTSHRDGPHFLNVDRVLDLPTALGLLAPDVKLTLVGKNAQDPAFDRTAAIYKLAGAADKFIRK